MSTRTPAPVVYPESDGKPMAENTRQYERIVTIKGNLDVLFGTRDDVFVAGDNLIYPVEGHPEVRQAPDVYVTFGRPKGHRGSYRVWEEDGVFPHVVFEVLSPGNRAGEMVRKFRFYERHGAAEYYVYDPDSNELAGWTRDPGGEFQEVVEMNQFVSPRLGIRFDLSGPELVIRYPDGRPFLTFLELGELAKREQARADAAVERAEQERMRADTAHERAARLEAKLRAMGIDPDAAR